MSRTLKKKTAFLPEIQPHFSQLNHSESLIQHVEQGKKILKDLLKEELLAFPTKEHGKFWFQKNFPLVKSEELEKTPGCFTLKFLFSPTEEVKAEKVLLDVIRKWLIPEKEVQILGNYSLYFYMKDFSTKLFFVAEVKILVESDRDLSLIQENLPLLSDELNLSLSSSKYLEQFHDTKGLTLNQKSAQVQHYLRRLTQRAPQQFGVDIFKEMSSFFALSRPEFRKFRAPKHLTRVIVSHFLMRKKIHHLLSVSPEKRHLEFRFVRSKLYFPFGTKSVLGLSLAVVLSDRYETFEDNHVVEAVQKYLPNFQIVKGSQYVYRANHDPIKYIYLELEKRDGSIFHMSEIALLKNELKEELRNRVEKLIPSVFMIRNEEEVMRNILLLSQELKYLSDIPQVMVNFEKQEGEDLFFTILVVRVLKKQDQPLAKLFNPSNNQFRFIPDRVQNVGYVRKKNAKEANVFHLCIPKESSVLRSNSSVNFYSARQKIISILTDALGEIRDYNGGMILKQGELFSQFKESFSDAAERNPELLENFFFALTPIESQATCSLSSLNALFQICLESIEHPLHKRESYFKKIIKKKGTSFAILRCKDQSLEHILSEELGQLENFSKSLIKSSVTYQGTFLLSLMYETSNAAQQKAFEKLIDSAIEKWLAKIINQKELRLSFKESPLSLDPRLGGDNTSSSILMMLFEGLTRISRDSKPSLALAKSVEISPDQKQYTFKLKPTLWSDGKPLSAKCFEYAWKKSLSPSFYTPFAYMFYCIKNARAAKEGLVGIDQVKVQALDDETLFVELENPTPEFLEQIAHPLFSPISDAHEKKHPNWAQSESENFICNGPMLLKKIKPSVGFIFEKNPNYWDSKSINLNTISISVDSPEAALEMYQNGEIDWLGHPMRPWESYFNTPSKEQHHTNFLGTHWSVFNTQRFPFDHLKIRQAFTYAVNREAIGKQFQNIAQPASSPLPHLLTSVLDSELIYGDKKMAVELFEEALKEMGLTRKTFPVLSLYFAAGFGRDKIAEMLVQTWEELFGISCRLEDYNFNLVFSKMVKGDFQIGMITWKSWINDPFYTLAPFQSRKNQVNFAKWEHPEYKKLLEDSLKETIPENRSAYFQQAEKLLIQECPVIPILHEAYKYAHKPELQNVICSASGNIDFRWASIAPRKVF